MGRIGYTYGSEWHLLRYMGYHRDKLNRVIEDKIHTDLNPGKQAGVPGQEVKVSKWLDFHFFNQPVTNLPPPVISEPRILDAERTGIDFLPAELWPIVPQEWRVFFPPVGAATQNWDAVGQINVDGEAFWLIVEAKGHLGELRSRCQAGPHAFTQIQVAFEQVRAGWNQMPILNWMNGYYQFCNRLACLHFLRQQNIPTKLLFIYFVGDRHPPRSQVQCPQNDEGWFPSIQNMEEHVGWLNANNPLAGDVHKLFLPVGP